MTYDEVLKRFQVKSSYQNRAQCICPSHDDKQASLTITAGQKGILLHCHAGCTLESVLKAAHLRKSDLFYDEQRPRTSWRSYIERREGRAIEAVYQYFYLDSTSAFCKVRLAGKNFICGTLQDSRFRYGLPKPRRELPAAVYGDLKALRQAISEDRPVFYVEGERDVQTMTKRGYAAITAGSVNDWSSEIAQLFMDAITIVLADNDQPGQNLAKQVQADLLGIAKSVKIITPTQDLPHGDISDFFVSHSKEEFEKLLVGAVTGKTVAHTVKPKQSLVNKLVELKAAERFAANDKGSAELFAEVFKDANRYNPTQRDFMFYSGIKWEPDAEGMKARRNAKKLADALLTYAVRAPDMDEERRKEYLKYAARLTSYRDRTTMVSDSRDLNFFDNTQLDADDYFLNCKNCVLDLSGDTPKVMEHDPDLLMSKVCGASYDPTAKCDLWIRTVAEIMQNDSDKIKYLQKIFGVALTGDCREEEMYIFYGATSRNGKSTITETALSLLADYSATITPETLAVKQNKDSRTASPDIAKLAGVRLVVASEPPKRMLFDTSLIKTLTGRDTVTARFLHQNEFSFKPKFKLLLNTNYLPSINDGTVFRSERIRVINFDKHFAESEQNKCLKSELRQELDGILNWAVEGLYLYRKEGLTPPMAIRTATSEYEADSDKIQRFISECLVKSAKNMAAKTAYDSYAKWCDESGCGTESKQNFFSELRTRGIFAASGTVDGKTVKNIIRGYELADEGFAKVDDDSPLPFD